MTSGVNSEARKDRLIRSVEHFRGCRDAAAPEDRLRRVRRAARAFREEMLDGPPVVFYHSADLIRVPYPTRYALRDACTALTPMIHIMNRLFVVQFDDAGTVRTLLVSPSDTAANRQAPFFKNLEARANFFGKWGTRLVAPEYATVTQVLDHIGISPDQIDYITFDHLHTQDLRRWLGTHGQPALFPRAKLLVMISDGSPTDCTTTALRALVNRLSTREGMCCAQVALRELDEVCFANYIPLHAENLDESVRAFGAIITRLVRHAIA